MADSKLTALTAITSFSGDELFYVVDDDDGTPVSRKITVEDLATALAGRSELQSVLNGLYAPLLTPDDDVVAAAETTTSTSYTDLSTSGPAVTATVPASGRVKVHIATGMENSSASGFTLAGFALSGENTVAATDSDCISLKGSDSAKFGQTFLLTGLTPGSTTFTMKYRVTSGAGQFSARRIIVEPC